MTIKCIRPFGAKLIKPALAAIALSASVSAFAATSLDRVIAIVNDDIIMQSELEARENMILRRLARSNSAQPPAEALRKQVLNRLIIDRIQMQLADERGIRVSDNELNAALNRIAGQSGLSLAQFRETLIAEGQDYAKVRNQIRQELLITETQRQLVNSRINVSQQEIDNFLSSDQGKLAASQSYNLSLILVAVPPQADATTIQQAAETAAEISTELQNGADFAELALERSAGNNALKGGQLGWKKAAELPPAFAQALQSLEKGQVTAPIRTPNGFHILKVNDTQQGNVQMVDQTEVRHILLKPTEIRSKAQTLREIKSLYNRLALGEPFAELAKEFSDDPGSGAEGGALGWAQPGQMVPEFEEVMRKTPVGEVSIPFETRFGWHILQVTDRRQQDLGEEMLINQARASIRERKFNEELQNWLREIRAKAYIELK